MGIAPVVPGRSACHPWHADGIGRAGYDGRNTRSAADAKPGLGEEHSHDDVGTGSLKCADEGGGRLSRGVDIVYHEDVPTPESLSVNAYVTLDVGAQLIVTSDVSPLAAARDSDVPEPVLGSGASAQEIEEHLPPACMRVRSTGRNTDDDGVRHVQWGECHGELSDSPPGVDVSPVLEPEDHPVGVPDVEGEPVRLPGRHVLVNGVPYHIPSILTQ